MKKFNIIAILLWIAIFPSHAQILYKVSGNGLEKPSYIFGTHHLAPLKVLTEDANASEAFKNASAVVTEIDMTGDATQMQMSMMPYMLAPQDSTLSKVLSPEDFAKVESVFSELSGMPLSVMEAFRPMLVSTNISVLLMMKNMPEFVQNEQLDTYINTQGVATGKKAIALETPEQQAQILFSSVPVEEQAKGLVQMVSDTNKAIEMTKKINDAYFAKDLNKLLELSIEEDDNPEFMVLLLDKRNADWLTKLPDIMKSDDVFVGVGALHLPGENGILKGLQKLGYTVEAVD